jgi:hypothetical protein
LPEGNLGLSKPSYCEKAGAGNFLLLGDFHNGLSTKRCTGGYDPDCAIHGFCCAPARSIDLTTAFSDARASSLLRSMGSTNQSRLAIFRTK